jgi:NADPH:quinone reductase-like Zn-dependent oxidoreductase
MRTARLTRPAEPAAEVPGPVMMQAIVQDRYGTAPGDVLRLEQIAQPGIAADEVLVKVAAAGVDRGTWHLMAGQPYLMRILGFGFRRPKSRVPGLDVAGTVVAAGPEVTGFCAGDEVFGIARGSFAEYAAAHQGTLARKPARLSSGQAAVVAVSGLAALQGLRDAGRIQAGQKVLIIGASGGIGTYAVQLAKAFGAQVTGVCSTPKADLVRSIGADHVIDYTREDFADGRQHYDLILDTGGNTRLSRLRRALTDTGTLVIAGGEGGKWTGIGRQLRALGLSPLVRQRLTTFISRQRQADLETLSRFIESGQVTPVVGRTCPLAETPEAIRQLAAGHTRGKIAIAI